MGMEPSPELERQEGVLARMWHSMRRRQPLWPKDDHGRARLVMNDLILHLHPPRVPTASLRFTYTFGLGGLAILLLVMLGLTGMLLTFAYTPSPDEAYNSIIALETQVWFGQLIRNLHHWSANLLLVVAFLHLLRVFYTAAFRKPREFNWVLGLLLLGLVAVANFTGYLLPWDQLAYWAVTVVSSLVSYIPLIGEGLRQLMLGGSEVSGVTLSNFFALHIGILPLTMLVTVLYHVWRVRKDKFTIPRHLDEILPARVRKVTTIPYLVAREGVFALVALAVLLVWSTLVNAPLGDAANPIQPPNPIKTAWYFMGIQELLLHFHPIFGVLVIPALTVGAMIALPYQKDDMDSTGIWFRSRLGRFLVVISLICGALATFILVLLSDSLRMTMSGAGSLSVITNGLLPLAVVMALIFAYGRLVRALGANRSEVRMAIFTVLLAAFITLTLIGVFLRGENMALKVF